MTNLCLTTQHPLQCCVDAFADMSCVYNLLPHNDSQDRHSSHSLFRPELPYHRTLEKKLLWSVSPFRQTKHLSSKMMMYSGLRGSPYVHGTPISIYMSFSLAITSTFTVKYDLLAINFIRRKVTVKHWKTKPLYNWTLLLISK